MAKITTQNIFDCYDYGKRVAEGELSIGTAAMNIAKTGMDKGSAQIYLRCVRSLIAGEKFTGTVNEMAMSRFLTNIFSDYGMEGLRKALKSLRMHLDYQSMYQSLPAIKRVYEEFNEILK